MMKINVKELLEKVLGREFLLECMNTSDYRKNCLKLKSRKALKIKGFTVRV